jgi:hypothetical protein
MTNIGVVEALFSLWVLVGLAIEFWNAQGRHAFRAETGRDVAVALWLALIWPIAFLPWRDWLDSLSLLLRVTIRETA